MKTHYGHFINYVKVKVRGGLPLCNSMEEGLGHRVVTEGGCNKFRLQLCSAIAE